MSKDLFGNTPIGSFKPYSDRQLKTFKKQLSEKVKVYLEERGSYDAIDEDLIAVYVQSISDIRRYSAIIEKEGEITTGKNGGISVHPLIALKQKAFDNSNKLSDKLGILSMNRKRLDGVPEGGSGRGEDEFSEYER